MRLGFELPNHPNPDAETWAQVAALRSTVVKVRPYHVHDAVLAEIHRRGLAVILRNDADQGPVFSLRERAEELHRALIALGRVATDLSCIVDNEPNHPNHGIAASVDYWELCSAVVAWLRDRHTAVRFISPPLAVMHGEVAWYAEAAPYIDTFDAVGVHLYGQLNPGFVVRSIALAQQFGKPLIADEIGDTHLTAVGDQKTAAVASYVRLAAVAGVQAATIFIAQRPTPEWAYCTLPTDKLAQIAVVAPQEVPMPVQTDIIVTSPHQNPVVAPGSVLSVSGYATGIDGQGMLTAALSEDTRPGTPQYGEPTKVSGVPIASDGWFSFSIKVPASTEVPAPATLLLSTTEIDIAAYQRGEGWGDAAQKAIAVVIDTAGSEQPGNDLGDVEQALHELWALAGGFRANKDVPNADYIESRVIRIKKAVGLE